jgi:hypothetical protein
VSETGRKDWKVLDVRVGKTEPNPHGGEFQKYYVDFEGSEDTYWRRKAGDKPEVGKSYYGTITEGNYGPMFKKEKRPDGAPSGSAEASTGSKGTWQPESQRDPERAARILRQHSQSAAVTVVLGDPGFADASPDRKKEAIKEWTDWFDRDVHATGQATVQGAGAASQSPYRGSQGTSPANASAPEQRSAEDQQDVEMALDTAGMVSAPARAIVANYMLSELEPARLLKACNQLTNAADLETQANTLQALKQMAERWSGEPLPTEASGATDPDDDIPF